MKKNNKYSVKYTRRFWGNNVPVLEEVENQYYSLSNEKMSELSSQFMNDIVKNNLQVLADNFCKYDCEGSFESMTDTQKVMHYLHYNYRSQVIIYLEQQYEKENNIIVKAHPSIEARKQVKKFFDSLECETVKSNL